MKAVQSRQKSYANKRRRHLEFAVGDKVFLKVAPMKGVMRFGKKGKPNLRFVRPFDILDKVGILAYRLALPRALSGIHNVFHVSMLRKYVSDPTHVLDYEPLKLRDNLTYEESPIRIVDREGKQLRNKRILLVQILWKNHAIEEATWEHGEEILAKYPYLFGKL